MSAFGTKQTFNQVEEHVFFSNEGKWAGTLSLEFHPTRVVGTTYSYIRLIFSAQKFFLERESANNHFRSKVDVRYSNRCITLGAFSSVI